MLGQMLPRRDPIAGCGPALASAGSRPRSPMSSTGMTTSTSSGLLMPASTMLTGRAIAGRRPPPRNRATSSSGRWVADRPMRCGGVAVSSSSRSRDRARWAPRLVGARAWISSTMTVSTPASVSAAELVSIRSNALLLDFVVLLVAELERLLRQSISSQMVADVPVGAFLSGGIDSSTVVALMQSVSSQTVRTYSIGFEEAEFNEAPQAAAVAGYLGTDHQELIVTAAEALATIPRLAEIWDEPFADSSQIPTALLAGFTRREVTVALSGDGGDELFCGYKQQLTATAIERLPAKSFLSNLLLAFGSSSMQLHLRALPLGHLPKSVANRLRILSVALAFDDPARRYMALSFQPDYSTLLLSDRFGYQLDTTHLRLPPGHDMLSMASAFDTVTYLPTDILAKVDRAAMAESLETRVPLLDHRIVEFAFSLPSDYKVRNGQTKWPLRQVVKSYVPPSLIDRPKMGFSVPIGQWLRGPLRTWAEDLLFARTCQDEIFNLPMIRTLWRDHQSGRWNYADHIWRLLMFRAWQARYE